MTYLDIVLIAVIQALAGVLPLSASGHFALFTGLSGEPVAFAAVSVAAHLGVGLGVALWLWRDVGSMAVGVGRLIKGKSDPGGRLFLVLLAASLPAGLLGFWILSELTLPHGQLLAAFCLLGFGLLLALADRWGVTVRRIEHQGVLGAVLFGLLQLLALVPGVSRTGIVVTAARLVGYERRDAARLALLLGIPSLLGLGAFKLWQLSGQAVLIISGDLMLATLLAAFIAWLAAGGLLRWLGRRSFQPFYLWRIMLGAGVVALNFLSA